MGKGLDGPVSILCRVKRLSCTSQHPDQVLGLPSLLFNGYLRLLPQGVKRQGSEADHSPPASVEVELYHHSVFMAWYLIKHTDNFTFLSSTFAVLKRPGTLQY
jgi:hypothetical protein